ncbi:MAG TPA: PAS domain-containing protein [Gaiellaceae bacterium]|nr:PAS domain-containing protein [Gaiellaceae bacterium]
MPERTQRHLALIVARELASQLVTPTLIADARGDLVFYNEPAERILGRSFAEAGGLPAGEWASVFAAEDLDGSPLPLERMPAGVALLERRPAHGRLRIVGLDGQRRTISVTAVPLFATAAEFVGVVVLFWEEREEPTPS